MSAVIEQQKPDLESEVQNFIAKEPYWVKFLLSKKLNDGEYSDENILTSCTFLLEDSELAEKQERSEIEVNYSETSLSAYQESLTLSELKNIEGVNALVENENLTFGPKVTIYYGSNGAGKTGYVRFLKEAFFSRSQEPILPDIHSEDKKQIKGELVFESSDKGKFTINYPENSSSSELHQYAVFDNKGVQVHLTKQNEFEFRPRGLDLFSDITSIYKAVEEKLDHLIQNKSQKSKDYSVIFKGESTVKTAINQLSANTSIAGLKELLPYTSEEDSTSIAAHKQKKKDLEKKKAELITLKKDKEIDSLNKLNGYIDTFITKSNKRNNLTKSSALDDLNTKIKNYLVKEKELQDQSNLDINSENINSIGSSEWKAFIEAADVFSKSQHENYPKEGDHCLYCHQSLSKEAIELIIKYQVYLKSQLESDEKQALKELELISTNLSEIEIDPLGDDSILKNWLSENHPDDLLKLVAEIGSQNTLIKHLGEKINQKKSSASKSLEIKTKFFTPIKEEIITKIKELESQEPKEELKKIEDEITLLDHKDKLFEHIDNIETCIDELIWIREAKLLKKNLSTARITNEQKRLSNKYFNQDFVDTFKEECNLLNGNFDIDIKHVGEKGTSFRQLNVKQHSPADILSEGEQKVISLADFLSEVKHFGMNRGIIFDDPVNSLDEERKSDIAKRLVLEANKRQVIFFTHDLVFVSSIIDECDLNKIDCSCHWIERQDGKPGKIWLDNAPSYEKEYKKSGKAREYHKKAKDSSPEQRESSIKSGFAALRTSYESMVIFDLFQGVVQRFRERVSIDSLKNVDFDSTIKEEIMDGFAQCCRYMEGHSHSDKYAYKKPTTGNLLEEIERFDEIKKKVKGK